MRYDNELNEFYLTRRKLQLEASQLSLLYIGASINGMNFIHDVDAFLDHISAEVANDCLAPYAATEILQAEMAYLEKQVWFLTVGHVEQYALIEKQKRGHILNLILKQVGFVGGGMQVFAGGVTCAASLGVACAAYGTPMIAHGLNNTYENGYYLIFHTDSDGYVREGYRAAARQLGFSQSQADSVYTAVDIGLSGYGMVRSVERPDSFRLFRHINEDYIRGWEEMGKVGLRAELIGNAANFYTFYQLNKDAQ